jgi:MFS family permease
MSPKEIRGQLGSLFQFFFTLGVMTSYWIDYAVEQHVEPSDRQWQIPIGLQLVPAGILGFGMLFLKESVRWLASKGRHEEALQSLIWIRGGEDTPEVRAEMAEILDGIAAEVQATEGLTWKELNLPSNRYRVFIAITIQICMALLPGFRRPRLQANSRYRRAMHGKYFVGILYVCHSLGPGLPTDRI